MIAKKYSIITLIFLLTSCGFKVIDYSKLNNFKIESIETNGENSINYRLKNKIKVISNEQSNNLVKLTIFSRKINNIKEKNIKNEITKYELEIITKVSYEVLNNNIQKSFKINVTGDYPVGPKYSTTIKNQANTLGTLTDEVAIIIKRKLSQSLNDL